MLYLPGVYGTLTSVKPKMALLPKRKEWIAYYGYSEKNKGENCRYVPSSESP